MSYLDHFKHADDVITHLNTLVPAITDPLLRVKYTGFVTVVAVTVYELAIKEIFIKFAQKKHSVFGNFTESYFERINGRIKTDDIKKEYLKKFGAKYVVKFKKKVDGAAKHYLTAHRRDIRSAYSNLITWRNEFAHEGNLNSTATYAEVVQSYEDGKEVIRCLYETMVR
ncbi:MAG: HEPN domain-containing protein [Gallionellaceae bacterium]|jgi:hypothetical protein